MTDLVQATRSGRYRAAVSAPRTPPFEEPRAKTALWSKRAVQVRSKSGPPARAVGARLVQPVYLLPYPMRIEEKR